MGYLVIKNKDHLGYNRDPFIQGLLIFFGFTLVAPVNAGIIPVGFLVV
jgi:hypothetical protein